MVETSGDAVDDALIQGMKMDSSRVLFKLIGANMNSTADQALIKQFAFNTYWIDQVVFTNASGSLALGVGGIFTGPTKTGTAIISALTAYSPLNSATKTLLPALANSDVRDTGLFLSLAVAAGFPATADVYITGNALT